MIRLAVRVPGAQAEAVLAQLLELVPAGLEERDCGDGLVEYAMYGAPGELPVLPELRAMVAGALVEVSTSEVPDDWSERWREFHSAVVIERAGGAPAALRVRPPWEAPQPGIEALEVVIDPGQAFGTGAHATTRLCLELLLELGVGGSRGPLLDVGTGSGVLAIAAAKLGYRPVLALDNDPLSVGAASQNASANGVAVKVHRCDLRRDRLPWPPGEPVVLANLLRPLLLDLAGALPAAPAELLAGGLLVEEAGEVAEAFSRRLGLRERARRRAGEWAALWLTAR